MKEWFYRGRHRLRMLRIGYGEYYPPGEGLVVVQKGLVVRQHEWGDWQALNGPVAKRNTKHRREGGKS